MRSRNLPPWWRANSQLNSAVRAPPIWRKPVGDGAKRVTTPVSDLALNCACSQAGKKMASSAADAPSTASGPLQFAASRRLGRARDTLETWLEAERDQLPLWVPVRSEEPTSELQSLMRMSYAVFCLNKNRP